jgi:hypothetical protein
MRYNEGRWGRGGVEESARLAFHVTNQVIGARRAMGKVIVEHWPPKVFVIPLVLCLQIENGSENEGD